MKFKDNLIAYDYEHNSRKLYFEIEEELNDCDIYIDFILPNGTKSKSARLTDLTSYIMPNALLLYSGLLGCQLVAYRGNNFIQKSKVVYYKINQSIDASQDIAENESDVLNDLQLQLNDKVGKEVGKGLSTNDFTNEYKRKIDNVQGYDDTEVRGLIAAETIRATTAEEVNAVAIAAETTRAQSVENELAQALSDIADVWRAI